MGSWDLVVQCSTGILNIASASSSSQPIWTGRYKDIAENMNIEIFPGLLHGEGGEAQGHCLRLRLEHEEHAEIKEIVKIDLNKKMNLKFSSI